MTSTAMKIQFMDVFFHGFSWFSQRKKKIHLGGSQPQYGIVSSNASLSPWPTGRQLCCAVPPLRPWTTPWRKRARRYSLEVIAKENEFARFIIGILEENIHLSAHHWHDRKVFSLEFGFQLGKWSLSLARDTLCLKWGGLKAYKRKVKVKVCVGVGPNPL